MVMITGPQPDTIERTRKQFMGTKTAPGIGRRSADVRLALHLLGSASRREKKLEATG